MRHQKRVIKLGLKAAPRKALMRNLATSLVIYERIETTTPKAKAVRPLVEKLVTIAKKNDLEARRKLLEVLMHKKAVDKILEVLGARYKERNGGYTRITKLGNRKGDNAEVSVIEFV